MVPDRFPPSRVGRFQHGSTVRDVLSSPLFRDLRRPRNGPPPSDTGLRAVQAYMVRVTRFERATTWLQTTASTKLNYTLMVACVGVEPTVSCL